MTPGNGWTGCGPACISFNGNLYATSCGCKISAAKSDRHRKWVISSMDGRRRAGTAAGWLDLKVKREVGRRERKSQVASEVRKEESSLLIFES